jgi:hypothetical protein
MFKEEIKNNIIKHLNKLQNDNELELKYFYKEKMTFTCYNKLIDYFNILNKIKKYELKKEIQLDILYKEYRFSIIGLPEINKALNIN